MRLDEDRLATACAMIKANDPTMVEMLNYARDVARIWAHLGPDEMAEQVETHLESNYPEYWEEARYVVMSMV